jgi:mRNA interferase YafQ
MLRIRYSSRFKKDYKVIIKRGYNLELFIGALEYLVNENPLPEKYLDHPLSGQYEGFRECHLAHDWLLVYKIEKDILTLSLIRTGTHTDLF